MDKNPKRRLENDEKHLEVDPAPFEHEQDNPDTHINEYDDLLVPVTEEELSARTREVERGSIRIEKDVVEEHQTLEVPMTEEEVHVSRRSVNRAADPSGTAFQEGTISVPIRGEEVDVQKHVRVTEEIDIDKDAITHNERVTDTVRREKVTLENDTDVNEGDRNRRNR